MSISLCSNINPCNGLNSVMGVEFLQHMLRTMELKMSAFSAKISGVPDNLCVRYKTLHMITMRASSEAAKLCSFTASCNTAARFTCVRLAKSLEPTFRTTILGRTWCNKRWALGRSLINCNSSLNSPMATK